MRSPPVPLEERVRAVDNRHIEYPPLSLVKRNYGQETILSLPPRFLRAGRGNNAKVNRVSVEITNILGDEDESGQPEYYYLIRVSNDVRIVNLPRDFSDVSNDVTVRWGAADSFIESENYYLLYSRRQLMEPGAGDRSQPGDGSSWSFRGSGGKMVVNEFSWVRKKPAMERRSPTLGAYMSSDGEIALVPLPGKVGVQVKQGKFDGAEYGRIAHGWARLLEVRRMGYVVARKDTDVTYDYLVQELSLDESDEEPIIQYLLPQGAGGLTFRHVGESRRGISGGSLDGALDWSNALPVLDIGGPARITSDEEGWEVLRLPSGRYVVRVAANNVMLTRLHMESGDGIDTTRHVRYVVRNLITNLSIRVTDRALRAKRSIASNLQEDKKEIKTENLRFMRRL